MTSPCSLSFNSFILHRCYSIDGLLTLPTPHCPALHRQADRKVKLAQKVIANTFSSIIAAGQSCTYSMVKNKEGKSPRLDWAGQARKVFHPLSKPCFATPQRQKTRHCRQKKFLLRPFFPSPLTSILILYVPARHSRPMYVPASRTNQPVMNNRLVAMHILGLVSPVQHYSFTLPLLLLRT